LCFSIRLDVHYDQYSNASLVSTISILPFVDAMEVMTDSFPERSTMVLTHLPSLSQSVEAS
jgi:hypothetical protein